MKYFKSKNTKSIQDMETGKVTLVDTDGQTEGIWVAKDSENKKMYLLNHAVAFYPVPSWGSEWPLSDTIEVSEAKGETPEDCVLTLHEEAFIHLEKFIDEENTFNIEKYNEQVNKSE